MRPSSEYEDGENAYKAPRRQTREFEDPTGDAVALSVDLDEVLSSLDLIGAGR